MNEFMIMFGSGLVFYLLICLAFGVWFGIGPMDHMKQDLDGILFDSFLGWILFLVTHVVFGFALVYSLLIFLEFAEKFWKIIA